VSPFGSTPGTTFAMVLPVAGDSTKELPPTAPLPTNRSVVEALVKWTLRVHQRVLSGSLRLTAEANPMTFPADPAQREPKGDHNRRLALGLDLEQFAAEAGVTPAQLKKYEMTSPDDDFDLDVAQHVGIALERLEQAPPSTQKVQNVAS
jgi:hypothetical protein